MPGVSNIWLKAAPSVGRVVGGGFSQSAYDVHITDSRPQGTNAWRVWADNPGESDRLVTAYAVCMTTES